MYIVSIYKWICWSRERSVHMAQLEEVSWGGKLCWMLCYCSIRSAALQNLWKSNMWPDLSTNVSPHCSFAHIGFIRKVIYVYTLIDHKTVCNWHGCVCVYVCQSQMWWANSSSFSHLRKILSLEEWWAVAVSLRCKWWKRRPQEMCTPWRWWTRTACVHRTMWVTLVYRLVQKECWVNHDLVLLEQRELKALLKSTTAAD